jgi:hypothetical protein
LRLGWDRDNLSINGKDSGRLQIPKVNSAQTVQRWLSFYLIDSEATDCETLFNAVVEVEMLEGPAEFDE